MSGSLHPHCYPFSAVIGQEEARLALVLTLICPQIGGVLLRGEKGTAKSTMVRGLSAVLPDLCQRTLSLGATEDRIVGGIDLEDTLASGAPAYAPGLLAEAGGGIVYIDEVNLLDDHLVDLVLDAAASGVVMVEREGISYTHPTRFSLIGTMNPEEGALRPQLLDRFGLCVDVTGEDDPHARVEIMRRLRDYDADPIAFCAQWAEAEQELRVKCRAAKESVDGVAVPELLLDLAVKLCCEAGVAGHRADVTMIAAARAHAAWCGRCRVTEEDILAVAELVLRHRRRDHVPPERPFTPPSQEESEQEPRESESPQQQPEQPLNSSPSSEPDDSSLSADDETSEADEETTEEEQTSTPQRPPTEQVAQVGESFIVTKIEPRKDRLARRGSGGRKRSLSADNRGRYIRARATSSADDLALDATLRAAAVHQVTRRAKARVEADPRSELAILIERSDWRKKVRVNQVGSCVIFVVDASGSMGARGRMVASKGAVLSLLLDAYVKRDKVALIAFRRYGAEVLLPPTSSIERADRCLRELPVGGRTPLGAGLQAAYRMATALMVKEPSLRPLVIVVSDGRGNVDLAGKPSPSAGRENLSLAAELGEDTRLQWVVVDTEDPHALQLGRASELAQALRAPCYRLDQLRADDLVELTRVYSFDTMN